jgi:hypothetical protein
MTAATKPDQTVGPVTIGEPGKEIHLQANLTHAGYHFLLAAMGSGRIGTDATVPGEIAAVALRLYMVRRPTTPVRNQWMEWEQALTEPEWRDALAERIRDYGTQVTDVIGEARDWFAEHQWPRWRPQLAELLAVFDRHATEIAALLPVLERVQRGTFAARTPVFLLPRRAFRIPVAFDTPLAIDLRMTEPAHPPESGKLVELLCHQLFHELATGSYQSGGKNLLHELDAALKNYSAHDASLDVWHSVAHFGAADLARRALGGPAPVAPGDRDTAGTRRLFLEPAAREAWHAYVEETVDAAEFADRIARETVRSNV